MKSRLTRAEREQGGIINGKQYRNKQASERDEILKTCCAILIKHQAED
jgi:hypothetical protein